MLVALTTVDVNCNAPSLAATFKCPLRNSLPPPNTKHASGGACKQTHASFGRYQPLMHPPPTVALSQSPQSTPKTCPDYKKRQDCSCNIVSHTEPRGIISTDNPFFSSRWSTTKTNRDRDSWPSWVQDAVARKDSAKQTPRVEQLPESRAKKPQSPPRPLRSSNYVLQETERHMRVDDLLQRLEDTLISGDEWHKEASSSQWFRY